MKKRNLFWVVILSILFVTPYVLYWLYVTGKEMNEKGFDAPPFKWLVYGFIGFFLGGIIGGAGAEMAKAMGENMRGIINVVVLLSAIVGGLAGLYFGLLYYYRFSVAAEKITNKSLNSILLFVLFLLISPAAVILIQYKLNHLEVNDTNTEIPVSTLNASETATPLPPSDANIPTAPPEAPAPPVS